MAGQGATTLAACLMSLLTGRSTSSSASTDGSIAATPSPVGDGRRSGPADDGLLISIDGRAPSAMADAGRSPRVARLGLSARADRPAPSVVAEWRAPSRVMAMRGVGDSIMSVR